MKLFYILNMLKLLLLNYSDNYSENNFIQINFAIHLQIKMIHSSNELK